MNAGLAGPQAKIQPRAHIHRKSPFYTLLGILLVSLAVAGFWPQYFSVITGQSIADGAQHWLIHVHALVFLGWLLVFLLQAVFILNGQTQMHRRLGPLIATFGFLAAVIGLFAGIALSARLAQRTGDFDRAASFVFAPTIDMVFLAAFLAIAVACHRRPEIHKRAMLVAAFSVAVVGIGRLVDRIAYFDDGWLWQPAILSPLLIALTYDLLVKRKLHGVLVAGILVHILRLNQEIYTNSEAWLPIGRALIGTFG